MPITLDSPLRRLSQLEFGRIAFEVLRQAFDIHRELGRLFDEGIYQAELAHRCADARVELPVEVRFGDFKKVYFIDLLVGDGAIFEIKTAEAFHDRHRAQLVNYLLLTDLAHGKLINFRPE
ncbi:MAG TPA: GxxExxY protein, partial [Pirellulales bacterium]